MRFAPIGRNLWGAMKIPGLVTFAFLVLPPLTAAPESPAPFQSQGEVATESALERLDERIRAAHGKILPAVAAILEMDPATGEPDETACATVVSADGLVVTAAHCLGDRGDDVQLRLGNGRVVTATTLGMNRSLDFGLMRIQGEGPFEFVGIQPKTSSLGPAQALLMYGYPGGGEAGRGAVVRLGALVGVRDDGMLCTECKMMPGDSGGGLFDLEGRLVGINSEIELAEDRNFHVPMEDVVHQWGEMLQGKVLGDFSGMEDDDWNHRSTVVPPQRPGAEESVRLAGQWLPGGIDGLGDALEARMGKKAQGWTVGLSSRRGEEVTHCQGLALWDRGLIVSKSSRVTGDTLRCRLPDGRLSVPEVLGRDKGSDLVLLRVDVPLAFASGGPMGSAEPTVGSLVVAPLSGPGSVPLTFAGVLASSQHRAKRRSWAQLGITVRSGMDEPAKVAWARRRGPARTAGVLRGDIVLALASEETPTRARMLEVLRLTDPGRTVPLVVERGGERLEFEVTLTAASSDDEMGKHVAFETEVSGRRGGFRGVLRHDISLTPEQCGGPVLDIEGRLLGMTLARVDRTGCVMLPYSGVLAAVDRILDQTGNTPPKDER